ncbi:hypothetical protein BKA62DRAFT_217057 [Auriculariales sp. MPI-PUGE-AT-0066]|nr:hypothetical protein BKA62DRAFT_217057 [Auriculariales sp. MPI-PUGE-AT-0066]
MDLLGEISLESAQTLLADVRSETSPVGSIGIPAIDQHLRCAISQADNATSPPSLRRGSWFQVIGSTNSGKTHFLYWTVLRCILPLESAALLGPEVAPVLLGRQAVVCDCDGRWNWERFRFLTKQYIINCHPGDSDTNQQQVEKLVELLLQRVMVFQTQDHLRLVANLLAIPPRLRANQATDELVFLAVDGLSLPVHSNLYGTDHDNQRPLWMSRIFQATVAAHAAVTVFTSAEPISFDQTLNLQPHVGSAFEARPPTLTHQIHLTQGATVVPSFPSTITPRQALADADRRAIIELGLVLGEFRSESDLDVVTEFRFEIRANGMHLPPPPRDTVLIQGD